jgi:hypothetical protein
MYLLANVSKKVSAKKLDIRGNADEIIANNRRSIGCPDSTDGGSRF